MGVEIERKYLLRGDDWRREVVRSESLRQGYLSVAIGRTVRVRLLDEVRGYLTIKGKRVGDRRLEYEYEIPARDAGEMLDELCERPLIEKTRHHIDLSPGSWTVDEFAGANLGLVLLEIERAQDETAAELPVWVGEDVTEDDRYANSSLQARPFSTWGGRQ